MQTPPPSSSEETSSGVETSSQQKIYSHYYVIRRNGKLTQFDREKIVLAITKAFLATYHEQNGQEQSATHIHEQVQALTDQVLAILFRRLSQQDRIHIEDIQDQVELALMRNGEHQVARSYVLYRDQHARLRASKQKKDGLSQQQSIRSQLNYIDSHGNPQPIRSEQLLTLIEDAAKGLDQIDSTFLLQQMERNLYDGISEADLYQSMILNARLQIDREPDYNFLTARLLLNQIRKEAFEFIFTSYPDSETPETYSHYFKQYIQRAVECDLLDDELTRFDLNQLATALKPQNDLHFTYLGLQTLYDRYFLHYHSIRFELPQAFFMRVAMGLAINEIDREEKAIEFYQLLSSFDFMCSTPTLFNSGTIRPQLSSCYLTTIPDDLGDIYSALKDNALLSKFAGGLGNDWTPVRGLGAYIKGTNGKSQGVVPFLKVANDTAVAVNQGGKRKGAVCSYLETWHIDIEEFLELRKNTGDERRRTHDMNTANWIPDLFMQRLAENKLWTLFSPQEVPDLHELYGQAFATAYCAYEQQAEMGQITQYKQMPAIDLWRKILAMLFETGHPWIVFKDPCNIRYSNKHQGVVHSSNLCTEITLHTQADEIAVCNLGSVNLAQHIDDNGLNYKKLEKTVTTAMRILDNVIDYNYYCVPQARRSNLRHRPVGLGLMGFQDALYQLQLSYASEAAVTFADQSMEAISYYAIQASSHLAAERGRYSSYQGSLWNQGILPIDSVQQLIEERANYVKIDTQQHMDWEQLRALIRQYGMRNSNCMAIAPTATISNICGVSQSIEPCYQNLYVKSNLSGEFTIVNPMLVKQLKQLNLWDEVMINDLKYYDGSIQKIQRIPESIKDIYATAFEIDSRWLIEAASRRQKWIDQAQSLNLYLAEPSGKKLDQLYQLAWVRGLKSTYYLRSMAATQNEKSVDPGYQQTTEPTPSDRVCSIDNSDCEACQ